MMLENLVGCLGSIGIIAVLIPWFLLCIPPFVLVFLYLQRRYVVVSREMNRLDGVSRSPMYAHFAQTLQVPSRLLSKPLTHGNFRMRFCIGVRGGVSIAKNMSCNAILEPRSDRRIYVN